MSKRLRDPPGRYEADAADIECPICLEPFWQPTRAEPCGHVACRGCLDRLDKCHICRAHVVSTSPCGAAASRRSHAARVSCRSCSWTGTRKQQVTQAHVMCPVMCKLQAEEKMISVMRDVYPEAELNRTNLLAVLHTTPLSSEPRTWDGEEDVVIDDGFFVDKMMQSYCPSLDGIGEEEDDNVDLILDRLEGNHSALQSLSGPTTCLLWTLLDACVSNNTELAVGLALRALAISPSSPDAFPAGLDWQYVCLLVAGLYNHSTLRELLRIGFTVPNLLLEVEYYDFTNVLLVNSIISGDFECLRLLIRQCPHIDFNATGFAAEMFMAVMEHKHSRWLSYLVTEVGCSVNSNMDVQYSYSPIHDAVYLEDANCVSTLISLGANLDALSGKLRQTPLHLAASLSDTECLDILLAAGANTEIKDSDGWTPLHIAAHAGLLNNVRALLASNADVNALCGRSEHAMTALYLAVVQGNTECVRLLLSALADAEFTDINGLTPLYIAVRKCNIDIVKALVDAGVDLDMAITWTDDSMTFSRTALHKAARQDNIECLSVLLAAGANTEVMDSSGWTPLHFAATGGKLDFVKALVEAGADMNVIVDSHEGEMTPLCVAARYGNLDIVKYLHERSNTPDTYSVVSHRNAVAQVLFATGMATSTKNSILDYLVDKGYYVSTLTLCSAIKQNNLPAVELLIQPRFNLKLDTTDDSGSNPLFEAVALGSCEIIKMLFDLGADLTSELEEDALVKGHSDGVFYLRYLREKKNTTTTTTTNIQNK